MIYLFYGNDEIETLRRWRQKIDEFLAEPVTSLFRFESENFDRERFEELICGRDLFGGRWLVVSRDLFSDERTAEFVVERIAELGASPSLFVFLEKSPAPEIVRQLIIANAEAVKCQQPPVKKPNPRALLYILSDAFASRDRKKTWLLYQLALRRGFASEEVFWQLARQVKLFLMAQKSSGPLTSVKPFIAAKAKAASQRFKEDELVAFSGALVDLWHESKRGLVDFDFGLERLLLEQ